MNEVQRLDRMIEQRRQALGVVAAPVGESFAPHCIPPTTSRARSICSNGDAHCRKCGEVVPAGDDHRGFEGKATHRPVWCRRCREHTRLAARRQERMAKRDGMIAAVARVLPPLFQRAHLRDLPLKLRERFLTLRPGRGLLLWGGVGTGKSHALAAWIRYIVCNGGGVKAQRIPYADLLLRVRGTYNGGGNEEQVLRSYRTCGLLVLEDLGANVSAGTMESDFSVRILEGLLDFRIERGLPTFASSNKTPDELAKSFDERVASRMAAAFDCVAIRGKDRRRQQ